MTKKLNKTKGITVRMTEEGYELLETLANEFGLSRGATLEMLVREKVRERAKNTVYVQQRDSFIYGGEKE